MLVDSSMTEIAVAAVTVAVGAAFYFGAPRTIQEDDELASPETSTNAKTGRSGGPLKKGSKKGKKKTMPGVRATSGEESTTAAEEPVVKRAEKEKELTPKPEVPLVPTVSKSKKKKNKGTKVDPSPVTNAPGPSQQGALTAASESSSTNDGAWTRVETRRRGGAGARSAGPATVLSDGLTTSVTGTEDEQEDVAESVIKPRTLAERMLPAGRKTGVEDMLETPQYPEVARVMRVKPIEGEQPAPGYTWGDYEDVDENKVLSMDDEETDEGGWGVVTSRRPRRSQTVTQASAQAANQASTENMTKKQRQNAAKREATKAAKVESEVDRQARLAAHKRQVEKERIAEQYAKPAAGKGKVSGGMTAGVNEKGSLIWE